MFLSVISWVLFHSMIWRWRERCFNCTLHSGPGLYEFTVSFKPMLATGHSYMQDIIINKKMSFSVPSFLSVSNSDCSRQDEQFSLVFTIASFLNNFLNLVNGYLFDRFGTMVTRLLGVWVHLIFPLSNLATQAKKKMSRLQFTKLQSLSAAVCVMSWTLRHRSRGWSSVILIWKQLHISVSFVMFILCCMESAK